jgi:hypothetical protein
MTPAADEDGMGYFLLSFVRRHHRRRVLILHGRHG